jgi:hypothetical protein
VSAAGDQDEDELLKVLQAHEQSSVGFNSDNVASEQIDAFNRYMGAPYGDEEPGKSSVCTREVQETIEWVRPDISRMFGTGGKAVEIDAWEPGSEQAANDATDFINQEFFEEQQGAAIIDAMFFDGAVQKIGVVGVFWQEAEMAEPQTYEGLNLLQATELAQNPNHDVLETAPGGGFDEQNPTVGPFTMKVQRVKLRARPYVKGIAPEDFRISPRAVDLDNVPYCGHIDRTSVSELKLLFPDKEAEIEEYANSSREGAEMDERRQTRFQDKDGAVASLPITDDDSEVILYTEYVYFDLDKDGYDELIEVKRLGACILSKQPVEENPYAAWSPLRVPHKLIGLSIADLVKDIQRTQTLLLRAAIDATYQSVAPRMLALAKKVSLPDLLTVRAGGVVRITDEQVTDVRAVVSPLTVPNVASGSLMMMERMDQAAEVRSGITRHSQGIDPDSLNKTATGMRLMQNAASVRKEMIARNFAAGLEAMFKKYFRLLVRQTKQGIADAAEQGKKPPANPILRVGRMWVTYTPAEWSEEAKVRVHVGQGTGDRDTQVAQLTTILGQQKELVATYGIDNPFATPAMLHNTISDIGRVMGFRSMARYFGDPADIPPEQLKAMAAPKPSPEMQKIQAQQQADQAKAAADQQQSQAKLVQDAAQFQQEIELKREQMHGELQLKREQMAAEFALRREIEQMKIAAGVYSAPPAANDTNLPSDVRLGGQPG